MAQISELELAHYSNEDIVEILDSIKKYSAHSGMNIVPQMAGLRKEQLLNIFRYLTSSMKENDEDEEEYEVQERPSKRVLIARAMAMDNDEETDDEEDEDSSECSSSFKRMMEELEYN